MDDHGSCIWRVAGLNPPEEGQEGRRVLGHPVVRPGRELEVTNLTLLIGAALDKQQKGEHIKTLIRQECSEKAFVSRTLELKRNIDYHLTYINI